jgi:hypothetical protein
LASDGAALEVLKEAFPELKTYELPGYDITYSKSSWGLKLRLLFSFFRIQKAVKAEHEFVQKVVEIDDIYCIISDNRFGVYHNIIPSVYITHQLTVLSGLFTGFSTKFHQSIIEKFDECWVPDVSDELSLSGKLSKNNSIKIPVKRIGVLSRLKPKELSSKYEIAIVLSGPEPQRTLLQQKMLSEFKDDLGKTVLIRGKFSEDQIQHNFQNLEIVNYANQSDLCAILNGSKIVIGRSGYSTIMDLAVLGKKAMFIPTPGQDEQEYLAKYLEAQKIAPFVNQNDFSFSALEKLDKYPGFKKQKMELDLKLFSLFHSE